MVVALFWAVVVRTVCVQYAVEALYCFTGKACLDQRPVVSQVPGLDSDID